jgi:hypothetical protein
MPPPAPATLGTPYIAPLYCPPLSSLGLPGSGTPYLGNSADPNTMLGSPNQQLLQDAANPFAQSTESGGFASRSFDNAMFGDFGGAYYQRNVTVLRRTQVGTNTRIIGTDPITQAPIVQTEPVFATQPTQQRAPFPLNGRYSGFKMSDHESVRPVDRLYFAYSYYGNINPEFNGGLRFDQHRQTIGFEKTLLGGNASIGLRLPFVQSVGEGSLDASNIGDLSVSLKYAIINDRATGTVRSAGLIITAPTGTATATLIDGTTAAHGTILQPWVGFSQQLGERFYAQGFSSIMVPISTPEPTVLFNSLSLGMWLLRSGEGEQFKGLAPVTEIHINTPLTNREPTQNAIYMNDQINITHGLHLTLPRAVIGAAFSYPLVSPRPFDGEALVTVNFRY